MSRLFANRSRLPLLALACFACAGKEAGPTPADSAMPDASTSDAGTTDAGTTDAGAAPDDLSGLLEPYRADGDLPALAAAVFRGDELIALGIGDRTARDMDHLPIAGRGGSLERLAALRCQHRVYTHINNTNPILLERSPERALVTRTGVIVGFDGLRLTLSQEPDL